jgi:hypothetical protein
MKLESLVIADQHAAVNMYSGLVHTARHTMGISFARNRLYDKPMTLIRYARQVRSMFFASLIIETITVESVTEVKS